MAMNGDAQVRLLEDAEGGAGEALPLLAPQRSLREELGLARAFARRSGFFNLWTVAETLFSWVTSARMAGNIIGNGVLLTVFIGMSVGVARSQRSPEEYPQNRHLDRGVGGTPPLRTTWAASLFINSLLTVWRGLEGFMPLVFENSPEWENAESASWLYYTVLLLASLISLGVALDQLWAFDDSYLNALQEEREVTRRREMSLVANIFRAPQAAEMVAPITMQEAEALAISISGDEAASGTDVALLTNLQDRLATPQVLWEEYERDAALKTYLLNVANLLKSADSPVISGLSSAAFNELCAEIKDALICPLSFSVPSRAVGARTLDDNYSETELRVFDLSQPLLERVREGRHPSIQGIAVQAQVFAPSEKWQALLSASLAYVNARPMPVENPLTMAPVLMGEACIPPQSVENSV